jgi:hypothetical protein
MSIKTRVGSIVKVINQAKKKNANDSYYSVLLKEDGHVQPYLFTNIELDVARHRARKNVEDVLKQSFVSKIID